MALSNNTTAHSLSQKPHLTFWQIWNISFGFMGVQIGYSLQNANTSYILKAIGADVGNLSYFWLAAPLSGLIVQPIVGLSSDKTWTKLGRRIPFILGGAFVSALAMFFMPNSEHFAQLLPAVFFGATMLLLMDTSFNVTMQPFRALVSDMVNDEQRNKGYSIQSLLINVGAAVGSFLPFFLTWTGIARDPAPGQKVAPSVIWSFYFGGAALLLSVLWTSFRTKEYPPEEYVKYNNLSEEQTKEKVSFWQLLKNTPKAMMQLAVTQFFSWFALFLMWVFMSSGIEQKIWGVNPYQLSFAQELFGSKVQIGETKLDSINLYYVNGKNIEDLNLSNGMTKALQKAHKAHVDLSFDYTTNKSTIEKSSEAGNWTGVIFGAYSIFAFLFSMVLSSLATRFSRKNVYAVCLVIGGIGLSSMMFINNKNLLFLPMVGIGIGWAAILALPYAILSKTLPPKQTGVYMGLFNATITIPQIVASLLGGVLLSSVGGKAINVIALAGAAMIVAGICAKLVITTKE